MRSIWFAASVLALSACSSMGGTTVGASLIAADASTALVTERITFSETTHEARAGMDPLVELRLAHPDGRILAFQQANHTAHDLFVQRDGGALAQIMGLSGEEAPVLYRATPGENHGAPFICGAEGPAALGYHRSADGTVRIIGLKQEIQVERRPDGQLEAIPYSPDQVCARLNFRQG